MERQLVHFDGFLLFLIREGEERERGGRKRVDSDGDSDRRGRRDLINERRGIVNNRG